MPFSVEDLAQHSGESVGTLEMISALLPMGNGNLFTTHSFRKKRGGLREIIKPKPAFDALVKNLNRSFSTLLPYRPPSHVHGFTQGRSTYTNASAHLDKECVLRIDLEDFFPSITSAQVEAALREQGYEEKAASLAVRLVTIFGKLPIGLSTSPFLSNLVFADTDRILAEFAEAENLSFTRYADDLTFSGAVSDGHLAAIEQIINDSGWSVNVDKTAFMRRGGPQYVTGLYVGSADRPHIPRKIKRNMRRILHLISKFGYETYMADFGGEREDMLPHRLRGWACYIAAVDPDLGYPMLRALEELPPYYIPPGDLEWLMGVQDLD